jgi:hypothetical protein
MLNPALHEVWAGFARPFQLLRALRRDPVAWRRYVRTVGAQTMAVVLLALVFLLIGDGPDEGTRRKRTIPIERVTMDGGVSLDAVVDALAEAAEEEEEEVDETEAPTLLARTAAWWGALVTALLVAQWLVLALSRQFQEPIARDLSALARIEPEDEARTPRLVLDVKWLRKKLGQRIRGVVVLLAAIPALVPVFILTAVLMVPWLGSALFFLWSAYWWCAFTAGRSARAWRNEHDAVPPFPVRWWLARTVGTFGFRWFGARWAGAFAVLLTRRDAPAAVEMERSFLRFVGLGLARFVTAFPAVRLAFRAAVDVAAAEALARSGEESLTPAVALTQSAEESPTAAGDQRPAGITAGDEQLVGLGDVNHASGGALPEAGNEVADRPQLSAVPLEANADGVGGLIVPEREDLVAAEPADGPQELVAPASNGDDGRE